MPARRKNQRAAAGRTGSVSVPSNAVATGELSARQLHALLVDAEKARRSGQLDVAEGICRRLLDAWPTYLGALQTFGLVALEKKNYPQAVNCFLTAAAEAPDDWTNYTNLAAAWLGLDVPQMAALMLREARSLNPHDPEVHFMLGEVFSDEREYEEAMESYRAALAIQPQHGPSLFKLSDCLINLGYFGEAADLVQRLHKVRPHDIAVVHLMLQLPRNSLGVDLRRALEAARRQDSQTEEEFNNNRQFVLASILDREGACREAWSQLERANAGVCREHAEPLEKAVARRARDLESAREMPVLGASRGKVTSQIVPLFILGPSRAGKTTLETLLAGHPEVRRGYENHTVEFAVKRAAQTAGLVSLKSLQVLPEPLHKSFAGIFRRRLSAFADRSAVVTNTNPGLVASAQRIAQALPEARFVFLTRNQDDTVLRILMKKYRTGNHHAYSEATARQYVAWYDEMTDVLSQKLPGRALRLGYENMVADPAACASEVLKLCGLEPDALQLPEIGSDVGAAEPYRDVLAGKSPHTQA